MNCMHCQAEVVEGMKFCAQCGKSLGAAECPKCGFMSPAGFKFCGHCGTGLLESDQQSSVSEPSVQDFKRRAERRQVTVLFSDLKDSVALSCQYDPEQYRHILRTYRESCIKVIRQFGGKVIRFVGDGIRVYFGYPQAHEDDAERAVRAGLGIIATVNALDVGTTHIKLSVRIGIATGLVVAGGGDDGYDSPEDSLEIMEAIGEPPNIAARIQSLAQPDTVVIAASTKQLLGHLFEYQDLGVHELKGLVEEPIQVWQVLRERNVLSRFEATRSPNTPLIDREEELELLLRRWDKAKQGQGQAVLLCGEAGIGKSRLTQALYEQIAAIELPNRLHYQCSPHHTNSALYPIINQIERDADFERQDDVEQKLEKLAELLSRSSDRVQDIIPLIAALLSIPTGDRYPLLNMSSQQQKQKTFAALVEQMRGLAAEKPLLVVFEDAHWIDPTSLELLEVGIKAVEHAHVLIVVTMRPEFNPPWMSYPQVTHILLNRLSREQTVQLTRQITAGKPLPDVMIDHIVARTEGVPLFVEEFTKTILDSGVLKDQPQGYSLNDPLPQLAIPLTLQDSLMARLDQLSPIKSIAQTGAAIGREFSYDLLFALVNLPEDKLRETLNQLVDSELLIQRGQTYIFRHALLQEAAYSSLLHSRRQELHNRIATTLEAQFKSQWGSQPELLAYHYSEAHMVEKAAHYWFQAGQLASKRSANREAISHLEKGLKWLQKLPDSLERKQQELMQMITLGPALITIKGAGTPEVEQAYARALDLCAELPESSLHFATMWGWSRISKNYHIKRERAEKMLALAQRLGDPGLLLQGHHSLWASLFHLGEQEACCEHVEKGLKLYHQGNYRWQASMYGGHDARVCAEGEIAQALWLRGYPDRALQRMNASLSWAQEIDHSASMVHAMDMALLVHYYRRDIVALRKQAQALIEFAQQHGYSEHHIKGLVYHGYAEAMDGELEQGISALRAAIDKHGQIGTKEDFPVFSDMLAEVYVRAGAGDEGLAQIDQALQQGKEVGLQFWEPELHRCQGELLLVLAQQNASEAQTCFKRALDLAEQQQTRSLMLRASMSLARLAIVQGDQQHVLPLLKPVYNSFNEGFSTADLQDAKALIEMCY